MILASLRKTLTVTVAAAALATAAPALASDLPNTTPAWGAPNRVAAAWQGFYVGVHAGYSWARYDATLVPGPSVFDMEGSSFSGGLFGGINFQIAPNIVAGVEADVTLMNPRGDAIIGGLGFRGEANAMGSLRGRVGMTFENLFVYVTGGAALGNVEFGGPFGASSRNQLGWALGLGVEGRITENLFARAEYIYTSFGADDYALGAPQRIHGDLDLHTLRLGLGYRF